MTMDSQAGAAAGQLDEAGYMLPYSPCQSCAELREENKRLRNKADDLIAVAEAAENCLGWIDDMERGDALARSLARLHGRGEAGT